MLALYGKQGLGRVLENVHKWNELRHKMALEWPLFAVMEDIVKGDIVDLAVLVLPQTSMVFSLAPILGPNFYFLHTRLKKTRSFFCVQALPSLLTRMTQDLDQLLILNLNRPCTQTFNTNLLENFI